MAECDVVGRSARGSVAEATDHGAQVARHGGQLVECCEGLVDALRERELAWSVRRLLSRRIGEARDAALGQLRSWGVDPATIGERFAAQRSTLAGWIDSARRTDDDTGSADDHSTGEPVEGSTDSTTHAG